MPTRHIVVGLPWAGKTTLALGVDVVLDFGVWSRDERTRLRHLAAGVRAATRLHYLPVDPSWPEWSQRRWPTLAG